MSEVILAKKHKNGRIAVSLYNKDDAGFKGEAEIASTVPSTHPEFRSQIEDGIWDVVKLMVDNGYETTSSCEGHGLTDPMPSINVKFDNALELIEFRQMLEGYNWATIHDTLNDEWFGRYQKVYKHVCRIKFNGNRKYNLFRLFDMYILKSWYAKRMFIRHVQNKLSS